MPHPNGKSSDILMYLDEGAGPNYNISYYRPGFYKVVGFKSTAPRKGRIHPNKAEGYKNDEKLPQALSRARRMILEYALCNDWKWFVTLTLDAEKVDRFDFPAFYKKFKEWHKYRSEKLEKKIPYLLIPEKHKDGAWHLHGFFNSDIDGLLVPFAELDKAGYRTPSGKRLSRKLRDNFFDCPDYRKRFGFCSFGKIRCQEAAAFYVTKYITKSLQDSTLQLGMDLYYHSRCLNSAQFVDSIYGKNDDLEKVLVNDYEYCKTGFYRFDKEPGFDPIMDLVDDQRLCDAEVLHDFLKSFNAEIEAEVDEYYEATQLAMKGFEGAAGLGNKRKSKR